MALTIAGSYYIFISSLDYKAIMKTQDHLNEMTYWCLFIAICSILTFLLITNIGLGATNEEKKIKGIQPALATNGQSNVIKNMFWVI